MKEMIQSTLKRVTLDLIYQAVDDRARETRTRIDHLEHETSARFNRLEDDVRDVRTDVREARNEMNRRFEAIDQKFAVVDQKFDSINGRLDQIFTILANQRREP